MPRLLDVLTTQYPSASKRSLRQMIAHGRVLVDGRPASRADVDVLATARMTLGPRVPVAQAVDPVTVAYEDDHLLVIDKPAGLISAAPRAAGKTSAWAAARKYLSRARVEPLLVHRLDEAASGLLLFAKQRSVQAALTTLFARHDLERLYLAVVDGVPSTSGGRITTDLLESDRPPFKVRSLRGTDPPSLRQAAERAITHWYCLASAEGVAAMLLRLQTGKKHQIRVHLAESGHPVVGDRLYHGSAHRRLLLHAGVLAFCHPLTGVAVRVVSPLPPPFRRACPTLPRSMPWHLVERGLASDGTGPP